MLHVRTQKTINTRTCGVNKTIEAYSVIPRDDGAEFFEFNLSDKAPRAAEFILIKHRFIYLFYYNNCTDKFVFFLHLLNVIPIILTMTIYKGNFLHRK